MSIELVTPEPHARRRNVRTHVTPGTHATALGETLQTAALLIAAGLRTPSALTHGVRLVFVCGSELSVRDLRGSPSEYVVIGRHTSADVSAVRSRASSLRHALAIPWSVSGRPLLELVPLAPTLPISEADSLLPDELSRRGSAFLMGDSILFVSPIGPEAGEPVRLHGDVREQTREGYFRIEEQRADRRPSGVQSHVTLVPKLLVEQNRARREQGTLLLELDGSGIHVELELTDAELTRGLLLGRSDEKSSHRAISCALASDTLSRLHALLRREGERVVLYHLASTNGCFVNGKEVRRLVTHAPQAALLEQGEPEQARIVLGRGDVALSLSRI